MNKKYFRVIYSKILQRLVVTSELAKSEGKAAGEKFGVLPNVSVSVPLKPLVFSFFCALGFVAFSNQAWAETLIIQGDKSAPKNQQPIVLQTANGLPQVNIQTPNEKGLSHNKYSRFDVAEQGAILNNSRKSAQTQQAGWVQGNPHLAKGEAKVILNEVNSRDPSVLKGYVEVAGKKADVIIANPAGIHCEGCGIINSDRSTLTTGKPQINHGNLDSFVVEKGKVKVSGRGLDNSRVDYTEILARESEINAGIWSKKETKVITGKNTVARTASAEEVRIIHSTQAAEGETKPQYAVDVGELGGMYSGKIHLIGTENGVGVRNAGHIGASAETLHIDSQGRIVNLGMLNAQQAVALNGQQGVENTGRIENKQGDIRFKSQGEIGQHGSVTARGGKVIKQSDQAIRQQGETLAKGKVEYRAPTVESSQTAVIAAGVEFIDTPQGESRQVAAFAPTGNNIEVFGTERAALQGKNLASGSLLVQGKNIDLDHSQNSAYDISLQAQKGNIQANQAGLFAQNRLTLEAPDTLSTQGSYLNADQIQSSQRHLDTRNAVWEQWGDQDLVLSVQSTLNNRGGSFTTQGNFRIEALGLDNQAGKLIAGKNLSLSLAGGQLDNRQGALHAQGDMQLNADKADNRETLSPEQGIVALGKLELNVASLDNREGYLAGAGSAQLTADTLNNAAGLINIQQDLSLSARQVTNDKGVIKVKEKAEIQLADRLSQQAGSLEAKHLILSADQVANTQGGKILADTIEARIAAFTNQDSFLVATQNLILSTSRLFDNTGGTVGSQYGDFQLNSRQSAVKNQQGKLLAAGALSIESSEINNRQGTIGSQQGDLRLNTQKNSLDNRQGTLFAGQSLDLQTGAIDNRQGAIQAKTALIHTHRQQLNNADTLAEPSQGIVAEQLTLHTGDLNNRQGRITAKDRATIKAQGLDNQGGEILAKNAADIQATAVDNQTGTIASIASTLSLNSESLLNNSQGLLSAAERLMLSAQGLDNRLGAIRSTDQLTIDTRQQRLDNQEGQIYAEGEARIMSGAMDNRQGLIRADQTLHINTHRQTLDNRQTGQENQGIVGLGDLILQDIAHLSNQQGRLYAK